MSYEESNIRVRSRVGQWLSEIRSNRSANIGFTILAIIVLLSVFAPFFVPHDATSQNTDNRFASPSVEHPMGTDHLGRDIFSRVLLGGRVSLFLGVAATGLGLALGIPFALLSAYSGGRVDEFIMRSVDIAISIPGLLLALLILALLDSNIWTAILAIGVSFAPRIARVVRGSALSVKNEEFIAASKVRGESHTYIIFRDIFPNTLPPIIVEASIRIGYAILFGTSLSFLGLGTQPPTPDWGFEIAVARDHIWSSPWPLIWPSLMLILTIMAFNMLGDGLSEILEPRTESEEI